MLQQQDGDRRIYLWQRIGLGATAKLFALLFENYELRVVHRRLFILEVHYNR